MRMTVDIPDALYKELKAKAARKKRSVKALILKNVAGELRLRNRKKGRRVTLPLIRSKRPGSVEADSNRIYDLISFP